jgi:Rhs element Vgr protein
MSDSTIPTPAPADRPSLTIKIDGSAMSAEYQVKALNVARSFNRVASAEIVLFDGDPAAEQFKVSSSQDFLPGNEIEITAGYHGNEELLFKGIVVRHGLRAHNQRPSLLRVECRDKAVKMTVGRKSAYFYDQKDSEIIESLAGAAGVSADVQATSVTHAQMVQFAATDWDFVVTRAEANGQLVITDDGTFVVKKPPTSGTPVLSLTYGRTMLDFEAFMDAREQYGSVESSAWDAAGQSLLSLPAASVTAIAPGSMSASDLAAVIGLDPLKLIHAGQLKDKELQAWADARQAKSAFAKARGRVRIQGFAGVKPGDVIELAGVGDQFNGKALVSGVRHEIDTKNWETDITFGLAPEWFGAPGAAVSEAGANGLLPAVTGLHIGLVSSIEDPDGEDRIKVRVPAIAAAEEGIWARVAALDAGKERGTFFRPEADDEVVLGFLGGDPRNAIVLGMMNSSSKAAPLKAAEANPQKGIITRSKITMLFDDEKKAWSIETPGGNSIVVSDDEGAITFKDQNGNQVVLDSKGVAIESAADVTIKATGDVKIDGANVKTNASAQLEAKGSAGAEFSSSGSTVLKGSMVQIN